MSTQVKGAEPAVIVITAKATLAGGRSLRSERERGQRDRGRSLESSLLA